MSSRSLPVTLIIMGLLMAACSKPNPNKITKPLDLPESDKSPKISVVMDFGNYELPEDGSITPAKGDGTYVPGELVLIRGAHFGRLPTVTIGGKATPVLLRLGDGGIFTRVPHGIDGGSQPVVVSTEKGLSKKEISIIRYAVAHAPGTKELVLYNAWNWKQVAQFKVGKVVGAAFAKGSSYAWFVTATKKGHLLITLDLAAQPTPRLVDKKSFGGKKILGFGYSASRKVLVAVTDEGVQGFSLVSPRFPIITAFQPWPAGISSSEMVEAALSPDGKNVAVLLSTDNTLALFDVQVLHNIKKGPRLTLLPEAKVPLLKSLGFFAEKVGQALYVLTGDTPSSLKVGYHDNKMIVLDLASASDRTGVSKVKIEETRPMMIEKITPSQVAIATRGRNKAEDTALTKWTRYFYFNTYHAELLTLAKLPLTTPSGIQQGIELIDGLPYLSIIHRLDQKSNPKTIRKIKKVSGALSIAPDGKQALSVNCIPKTDKAKLTVTIPCEIEILDLGTGRSTTHARGTLSNGDFLPPFRFGVTAIQE